MQDYNWNTALLISSASLVQETKDGSSCVILFPSQRQQAQAFFYLRGLGFRAQGLGVQGFRVSRPLSLTGGIGLMI